jgi:hypothetical protein
MTTLETTQKTLGKKTLKMIVSKVSGIVKMVRTSDSVLLKDSSNKTLAVWMPRLRSNGIVKVF